ncbi:MAG: class I SAM-dependent methyltransferase [Hyphomicrobiales bacterium]|nr:class I SAM-dependent methyltransferase [Hyphomicrobiales bacterium]
MELEAYRNMAATEDDHWWFCGRRAIVEAVVRAFRLPSDIKILEIGAGTGGNLKMLEQFGSVTAVEMSDLARLIAREKTGRDFLSGHLPDNIPVPPRSCDLICLFDVLEHVAEDETSLMTIGELLKPGGRIVLTVPAHQWLWSTHDVGLRHMRRYSRGLLRERVENAGYVLEKLTYMNTTLFPLAMLVRLADRIRKAEWPSGHAIPPQPINSAMKAMFSAERHVLKNRALPFGVSLLAVFGKPATVTNPQSADWMAA